MAENNITEVPEGDISTLEEALCVQQQLLQQLYTDLDVEREASATAASEALSMILRLQGEKASLMMEASHYKRMAEEKICHAEEALAIFEDLIYQREMEIASLEFQVQAYRYRLISMGCNDLGVYENKIPENLLMQRNENLFGEMVVSNNIKRFNSLPPLPVKDANRKKSNIERKRSVMPVLDSFPSNNMDENANQEGNDSEKKLASSAAADSNFYWEQIKKLDERMKEISDSKDSSRNKSAIRRGGTWCPSLFSQASIGALADPKRGVNASSSDQVKHHEISHEKEAAVSSDCSSSVQDIFEVPHTTDIRKAGELRKKECCKLILEGEKRLIKPDLISEDTLESPKKDETYRVKAMLVSKRNEKQLPKPRDGKGVEHNAPLACSSTVIGDPQAECQHLIQRIERLERARNNVRHEIIAEGEEELTILKEIRGQLKWIESEMRSWKSKSSAPANDPALDLLSNAMLYFWM